MHMHVHMDRAFVESHVACSYEPTALKKVDYNFLISFPPLNTTPSAHFRKLFNTRNATVADHPYQCAHLYFKMLQIISRHKKKP